MEPSEPASFEDMKQRRDVAVGILAPKRVAPTDMSHLLACEALLDTALSDWRIIDHWNSDWIEPAEQWSEAVWNIATRLGAHSIAASDQLEGERIASMPLFICGAHRSGTTLMRDLLDGHPALAVLPSEGQYFGNWEQRAGAQPSTATALFAREWLRRLANPIYQPPYWLLGRSDSEGSPYVHFARAMLAWDSAFLSRAISYAPLGIVALALATYNGAELSAIRYWVDKTPGYEFHLRRIWARFPQAKVIQMVRSPTAIAASYVAGLARTGLRSTPVPRMLRNLAQSYVAGIRATQFAPADRHLIVHYEALVADRPAVMARVAEFLGIEQDDSLMRQTIMNHIAEPNSSFHGMKRGDFKPASPSEYLWLTLARLCHTLLPKQPGQQ